MRKVRGLKIISSIPEDLAGWIDDQVMDDSELHRQVLIANAEAIARHFAGLSAEEIAERKSINEMLQQAGYGEDAMIPEPPAERAALMIDPIIKSISEGELFEYGVRIQIRRPWTANSVDDDSVDGDPVLNLVMKHVIWDNDEMVQVIKLDDPDFNLIVDFVS
jgi:hypothetical protein